MALFNRVSNSLFELKNAAPQLISQLLRANPQVDLQSNSGFKKRRGRVSYQFDFYCITPVAFWDEEGEGSSRAKTTDVFLSICRSQGMVEQKRSRICTSWYLIRKYRLSIWISVTSLNRRSLTCVSNSISYPHYKILWSYQHLTKETPFFQVFLRWWKGVRGMRLQNRGRKMYVWSNGLNKALFSGNTAATP